MIRHGDAQENKTGMTCENSCLLYIVSANLFGQDKAYSDIMAQLVNYDIEQVNFSALSKEEDYLHIYFTKEIKPLISPRCLTSEILFRFSKTRRFMPLLTLSQISVKIGLIPASGTFSGLFSCLPPINTFMLAEPFHYASLVFEL